MLKTTKTSSNRLDLELSGSLDSAEMRAALNDLLEKAEGITHGKMIYRILDFEMPTMSAIAVELQLLPKLFGVIAQFEKCAVLSDAAWIRTAAEIKGAVIPSLEIKSFSLSETEAAEAWLEGATANDDLEEDENFPV